MKTRSRVACTWSVCIPLLLVAGCGVEQDELEDVEEKASAVTIYPRPNVSSVEYGTMWQWSQDGSGMKPLVEAANNACFLNSVWGTLKGTGDEVTVDIFANNWGITGLAGGGGSPAGDGFCVRNVTPTARVDVVSGQSKVMGVPVPTNTCFLTAVRRSFNSAGSYVRLRQSGSDWLLEAGGGAGGSARCIPRMLAPEYTVSSPGSELQLRGVRLISGAIPVVEDALNPTGDSPYFCALTRVQGHLRGISGAWVGTFVRPIANDVRAWRLGEGSYSAVNALLYPLSGSARCVR